MVELLVVISIVALLIALLLPALGRAKETARRAVCLSNLHQMGVTMLTYAQDHRGQLPEEYKNPADSYVAQPCNVMDRMWKIMNRDYGANDRWFICPSLAVFLPASGTYPAQTFLYDSATGDLASYGSYRTMGYVWLQRLRNLPATQVPTNVPTSPSSIDDPSDRHLAADFNWQARGAANMGAQWMTHYTGKGGCLIAEGSNRLYLGGNAGWVNASFMGANDTPLTPGAGGIWAGTERFSDAAAFFRAYFW